MVRGLLYIPIIHTSADLGSIAEDITRRGMVDLGEDIWKRHEKTIEDFWGVISSYFDGLDVSGMKIYQDGMVAEGEIGEKIVEEGIRSGSRNYELVSRLLKRGALLVKTEDLKLVKKERDRLFKITRAKGVVEKLLGLITYKMTKGMLLTRRDRFIARRIDETLNQGEMGIVFIGAFHHIKKKLPKDIQITEVKDADKVREYHRLLPFYRKDKGRFEELRKYLVTEIKGASWMLPIFFRG